MSHSVIIEFYDKGYTCLSARESVEKTNKSTIANRAVELYALLTSCQDIGGNFEILYPDGSRTTIRLIN